MQELAMIGLLPILLLLRQSHGQRGDGCGLTVLGPESGTLASRNYPGTYPNNTNCEWRITVAEGLGLAFTFGDLNLEYSQLCSSGSLSVSSQSILHGPYCGKEHEMPRTLQVNSSDAVVLFSSGTHRSGRGFLLSYASTRHPDLISCLKKGIHYSSPQVSVYCPAGCKDIAGDIWGHASQGYRDTSVICKAAVHAGAISDNLGGLVLFTRGKGITLYEATVANGLQSQTGSLSEKRLMFNRDCDEVLDVTEFSASSSWHEVDSSGQSVVWSAERANLDETGEPNYWAAESSSDEEWLEMDLGGRKNITGIMTRGSSDSMHHFYVKSYKVLSSRDGKTWKAFKLQDGKNEKVFEGNTDRQQATYNNFIPPIVSRFLRIAPRSWNTRIALKVKLFGCLAARAKNTRINVFNSPRDIPGGTNAPAGNSTGRDVAIQPEEGDPLLMVILIVVGLVLITTGLILFGFLYHKKRKTAAGEQGGCFTGYQKPQSSQMCCRPHLRPSDSELMSYSDEGSASGISATQSPDYAEPDVVGQKIPSTFKPALDDGYTLPLVVNHYDVPGRKHEYTEPLPPEPEYATPFSDQALSTARRNICIVKVIPPAQGTKVHLASSGMLSQYDAPAPRGNVEEEEQTPSLPAMASEGHTSAGAVGGQSLPYRTLTSGGGACRELPPVPWSHSQNRDSLPHVYHEPL